MAIEVLEVDRGRTEVIQPGYSGPSTGTSGTGPTGPQGPAGNDGDSAYQAWITAGNAGTEADFLASLVGAQGPIGLTGPAGADGNDGAQGPIGLTGPAGADGNDGAQGPIGLTGPAGADGNDGAQGPIGLTGPAGADGNDGAQGPIGLTGPAGADGNDGAQGPIGLTGPAGADGNDGAQGPIGLTGPAGADGNDGAQGPIGLTGPAGNDGADGAQGPIGLTGPAGPGLPTGGTVGQIITKSSATDFDTGWSDPAGASVPILVDSAGTYVAPNNEFLVPDGSAPRAIQLPDPATLPGGGHIVIAPDAALFDSADALEPAGPNLISITSLNGTVHGVATYTMRSATRLDAVLLAGETNWRLTGFSEALTATEWITPTLLNSFVDVQSTVAGADFAPLAYRRDELGNVRIRGAVDGSLTNAEVFSFATGFVPQFTMVRKPAAKTNGGGNLNTNAYIAPVTSATPGRLIFANGAISTASWLDLSGVTFSVL